MFYYILFVIISLIGLVIACNIVVNAAQAIARTLRVSEMIIGLTVTSIGTSLPEIFTTIAAAIDVNAGIPASGLAIGDIIGSNIANITLVLGIGGIAGTLALAHEALKRDGLAMLGATISMLIFSLDGQINQIEGVIMLMIFVGYILFVLEREKFLKEFRTEPKANMLLNFILIAMGIGATIYFSDKLVFYGIQITEILKVPPSLIGVIIGLGTSLPEISVSIMAIIKKSGLLSIGNLIGSNIVNSLLALGIGAAISGFTITSQVMRFDMIFMVFATVIALLLLFNHLNLSIFESSVLIVVYMAFIYLKVVFSL